MPSRCLLSSSGTRAHVPTRPFHWRHGLFLNSLPHLSSSRTSSKKLCGGPAAALPEATSPVAAPLKVQPLHLCTLTTPMDSTESPLSPGAPFPAPASSSSTASAESPRAKTPDPLPHLPARLVPCCLGLWGSPGITPPHHLVSHTLQKLR